MNKFFLYFIVITCSLSTSPTLTKCSRFPPEGVSPLFSFGHTILPKGTVIIDEAVLHYGFTHRSATIAFTDVFYSITDALTVNGQIPIFSQSPPEGTCGKKTGLADILLRGNYQIYLDKKENDHRYRIITTAGVRVPSSTVAQKTIYSLGATNFFLGITHELMTNDWYIYNDFGAVLTTKRHCTKAGNIILNNAGIGRVKCFNNRLYLTFFAELSSFYSRPDTVNGKRDLTTGETIIFVGPTFRLEYLTSPDPFRSILLQLGFQYVVDHRTRVKPTNDIKYVVGALLAYIF